MAVIERLSAKIESGQSFTDAEVGELSEWFDHNEDQRDAIVWMLMGGDDAREWAKRLTNDGSPDDGDKRSKAQSGDVDKGDPVDSGGVAETDESGDPAGEDTGEGEACQCCKTYSPDKPEGDIEEAVKQYGPDAAYMPMGFKGYTKATGDADDTARDGEPETPIQRMARLMSSAFKEQEAAVLAAIKGIKKSRRKTPEDREEALNDPRIAVVLQALDASPLMRAAEQGLPPMVAAGAQSGIDAIGGGGFVPPTTPGGVAGGADDPGIGIGFDVSNPLVERAVRERAMELAGDLNQTTINRLRDSLADGIAGGESPASLASRVREQFSSFSDSRAETIARTESAMAYETGQQAAWSDSGVVEGKQFLIAPGACQFCEAVDQTWKDKTVDLNAVFVPKGATIRGTQGGVMKADYRALDAPPVHPQCRCDLIPVLGGEFKSLQDALTKGDTKSVRKFWSEHGKR